MQQLGNFVYYRTYSRYLPNEGRREYWWETVRRAVEYNCSLAPINVHEAEELYDNIFNLRQFLSGRTLWTGNTDVSLKYPMSNFNCAFTVIDNFKAFSDAFYLLMIGSGVGFRILKEDVEVLPKIRNNYDIIQEAYLPVNKDRRLENTSLSFTSKSSVKLVVGDSKEGWVESLKLFFELIASNMYKNIETIVVNYDNVRPKGEKLKTFGGTASGHESLRTMFVKIDNIIRNRKEKGRFNLKSIDCLDIMNIIGENVVSGGVRRTSEIALIGVTDDESINAKNNIYTQGVNNTWIINTSIQHRQMSNNSIFYTQKPTREKLHGHIKAVRFSGEPGWINEEAANKRRPNFKGVNPCSEVLLDSRGLCNLTTINVMGFVDTNGHLDTAKLLEAQALSARAGYRMTCPELELHNWNTIQQRDKLLGLSLTGWQDMVNATGMSRVEEESLLDALRDVARTTADNYAEKLGMRKPLLVTTVKPEGTLSLLPIVSNGVHFSHSPFYIRRVRISADDPLTKVCDELGYPVFPEVGQDIETCKTKVVEFPIKAPDGRTKKDITAIEQLEIYKMFMEHYVDHNASITVTVKNDEWDLVEDWLWKNWDTVVGISLLPDEGESFYTLQPLESCSEEEYNRRVSEMKPFIPSLINKYESEDIELDIDMSDCASGSCPIR